MCQKIYHTEQVACLLMTPMIKDDFQETYNAVGSIYLYHSNIKKSDLIYSIPSDKLSILNVKFVSFP